MMVPDKGRIVIAGGGFAGAYCAQALERLLRGSEAEVWLVDRRNYFVFSPLLIEAGTGSLEPRHAVVSIRDFLKTTTFRMAEISAIDPARQELVLKLGEGETQSLRYDQLVVAVGSVTNLPPVPGLHQYGFELKNLADAVGLRDRAIELLERATATRDVRLRNAMLHWVVVGGNYTGVELAGEFNVLLRQACRRYRELDPAACRVTLVERQSRILPALDEDLAQYAIHTLRRRGVDVRVESSVSAIEPDRVTLTDGSSLDSCTVIWCAGVAPPPVLSRSGLPLDPRGYVLCERDLRVKGFDNVWAIGDCAVNLGPDAKSYPATAQHGVREGIHLAHNLARVLRGEPTRPCNLESLGALAPLGCRTAVAKVLGVKLSGLSAWFLWRSVYLMKMPGWSRRVRIALDWTLDLFFRRHYVQLGLHRPSRENKGDLASTRKT